MRVISGKAKGATLKSVPGDTTRPITDRAKEALFNIIGQDVQDADFLDLFGGTGAVGIEALSRGAAHATFLDTSFQAIKVIKENLTSTHLYEKAEILHKDAFEYLKQTPQNGFDYIFIAPPQFKEMWKKAITLLINSPQWLNPGGWIIIHIDSVENESLDFTPYSVFDQRKYGDSLFIFLENNSEFDD